MTSNLAVVCGIVPNDPRRRALPGGDAVVQFDVTTRVAVGDRSVSQSVPVAWYAPPPAALDTVAAGAEVVVVGTVRRRFFRVGGATQSRTEVVADRVVPTRRHTQVAKALSAAAAALTS